MGDNNRFFLAGLSSATARDQKVRRDAFLSLPRSDSGFSSGPKKTLGNAAGGPVKLPTHEFAPQTHVVTPGYFEEASKRTGNLLLVPAFPVKTTILLVGKKNSLQGKFH